MQYFPFWFLISWIKAKRSPRPTQPRSPHADLLLQGTGGISQLSFYALLPLHPDCKLLQGPGAIQLWAPFRSGFKENASVPVNTPSAISTLVSARQTRRSRGWKSGSAQSGAYYHFKRDIQLRQNRIYQQSRNRFADGLCLRKKGRNLQGKCGLRHWKFIPRKV